MGLYLLFHPVPKNKLITLGEKSWPVCCRVRASVGKAKLRCCVAGERS